MWYSRMQIKVGWWNLQLHGALVCLFLLWIHDTSQITLLMVLETQPCGWQGVSCNSSCIEPPVSLGLYSRVCLPARGNWHFAGAYLKPFAPTPGPSSPSLRARLLLTAAPLSWCPVTGHSAGRDRLVSCRTRRRRWRRRVKFQPLRDENGSTRNAWCASCALYPVTSAQNTLHSQLFRCKWGVCSPVNSS